MPLFAGAAFSLSLASAADNQLCEQGATAQHILAMVTACSAILMKFRHQCFPVAPATTACAICLQDNKASLSATFVSASARSIWNNASPNMSLAIAREAQMFQSISVSRQTYLFVHEIAHSGDPNWPMRYGR